MTIERVPPPMMECGHAANAVKRNGRPICAICYGIDPGSEKVTPNPDLTGRLARCIYSRTRNGQPHNLIKPSDPGLPFFAHLPEKEYDDFYCGCWGWD